MNTGQMKIRYLAVVISVTLFTALAFYFLSLETASQNTHSKIINISGRQRMFSQNIPLLALEIATNENKTDQEIIRRQLIQNIDSMSKEHEALAHGPLFDHTEGKNRERMDDIYYKSPDHLDAKTIQFLRDAKNLVKEKGEIGPDNKYVHRLVSASPLLLASLEKIVTIHQIQNEDINTTITRTALLFIAVMIFIQTGAAFFVFYPSIKRVESDARQLEEMEKLQRELSKRDSLTTLNNRRSFDETIKREWAIATRNKKPLSIIMSDIDFFKQYNDHFGHQAGDKCLQAIAKQMELTFKRPGDYLARYGGEEFIAVLTDTNDEGALKLAEELRENVLDLMLPHPNSSVSDVVTISIGVATSSLKTPTYGKLVSEADQAMYRVKNSGRNRVELFSDDSDMK